MSRRTSPVVAALLVVAASAAVHGACLLTFHNKMPLDTIRLCGRQNGAIPGAWYSRALEPGATYTRGCTSNAGTSFETYFTVRNDTACGWDQSCQPDTGTCQSYPWVLGQGLASNGLWYGGIGANWDGNGLGYTASSYTDPTLVDYGVRLSCSSYGTSPWNATCDAAVSGEPACTPNVPNAGRPNSGIVACGPRNKQQGRYEIRVEIFDQE